MKRLIVSLVLLVAGTAGASDFGEADLVRRGRMVFDSQFTEAEQDRLKPLIVRGMGNVAAFFGERRSELPDFFFCKSIECAQYMAGSEWRSFAADKPQMRYFDAKHWFERPAIVITVLAKHPKARDEALLNVITHELSHIEFRARAGREPVPAWFEEGLATVVGGARCSPDARGIDDLAKLSTLSAWTIHTRPSAGMANATYCQAALEVLAWTEQRGGAKAIVNLLASLPKKSFESQYGSFMTAQGIPATNPTGIGQDNNH